MARKNARVNRNKKRYPKRYCTMDFLKCIGYEETGKGIVMFNDKPFYVDELIEGEEARILVYLEEDDHGTARAVQIKEWSPKRALPLGHPKFSIGSYQLPHLKDEFQDEWKQNQVEKLFGKVKPIIVGKRTYYRNKVQLHNGGFMSPGKGRLREVVPTEFDLMEIDFKKYEGTTGDIIIRRLDTEIEGRPGEKLYTTHTLLGKKFRVGLNSFYQVNNEMMEKAYSEIISWVPESGVVFDLFGGAATIGIHVSDKAKIVYSVEWSKDTHEDAKANILLNGIKNVIAICGDANAFATNKEIKADVIIVDPARAGLSEESAKAINESGAKRIIYLSCNIQTQKRDVDLMTNYNIVHIQPYDFFPQTYHIENLIVLDKK